MKTQEKEAMVEFVARYTIGEKAHRLAREESVREV